MKTISGAVVRAFFVLGFMGFGFSAMALSESTAAQSPEFESVVFYRVPQYDKESKEEMPGYCNGTLLSSRVMVTAAHCLFMAEALNSRTLDIEIGEYKKFGYATISKQTVTAKFLFPADLKKRLGVQGLNLKVGPSEDLAVAVLDQELSVKSDFRFGAVLSQTHTASVLGKVLNYWPTVVTVNPFEEIQTMNIKRMARLDRMSKKDGHFESQSTSRVEPGDSGAPLFARVGPEWKQIGVTKGRAETFFSNWDVLVYFGDQLCLIANQIGDAAVQKVLCPK